MSLKKIHDKQPDNFEFTKTNLELADKILKKYPFPSVFTWNAMDILPYSHNLNFGRPGVVAQRFSNFVVQNSDYLIILGSRVNSLTTGPDKNKFARKNCKIVGVSRDSIKSHKSFIEKESLNFPLISDPDETMCNAYGVMKEKSMYGRKYMGIERSTFLIGPDGLLIKEWRGVKVPGHVEEVYNFLSGL